MLTFIRFIYFIYLFVCLLVYLNKKVRNIIGTQINKRALGERCVVKFQR